MTNQHATETTVLAYDISEMMGKLAQALIYANAKSVCRAAPHGRYDEVLTEYETLRVRLTQDPSVVFLKTPPEEYVASLRRLAANTVAAIKSAPLTEADPHGKSPHQPGAKLDAGKNRMGLVLLAFARALTAVSQVGTYGANKYTDHGWIAVPNGQQRYTDALLRHIMREATGELHDPDTNLHHAAHAAWNALARLDLLLRANETENKP